MTAEILGLEQISDTDLRKNPFKGAQIWLDYSVKQLMS